MTVPKKGTVKRDKKKSAIKMVGLQKMIAPALVVL